MGVKIESSSDTSPAKVKRDSSKSVPEKSSEPDFRIARFKNKKPPQIFKAGL